MDFLELVTGARTCRRFREAEGMPAGTLDWLIECARVTPCGGNAQALRFADVYTRQPLDCLRARLFHDCRERRVYLL